MDANSAALDSWEHASDKVDAEIAKIEQDIRDNILDHMYEYIEMQDPINMIHLVLLHTKYKCESGTSFAMRETVDPLDEWITEKAQEIYDAR